MLLVSEEIIFNKQLNNFTNENNLFNINKFI
jgi:hypothetical protein